MSFVLVAKCKNERDNFPVSVRKPGNQSENYDEIVAVN